MSPSDSAQNLPPSRSILIVGASSGVGQSIARALARPGVSLGLHGHRNVRALAELEKSLAARGCRILVLPYDLSRTEQAQAAIESAVGAFGRLDVVANVVGPFDYRSVAETSPQAWRETIDLNLHTCFDVIYYAVPHLRKTRGHIVNFAFAGVENLKAWPMSAAYCAAKAGVAVLTKSWAAALAPEGVRVNALCPGLVEEGDASEAERRRMAEQIPLGRPVRPEEIAEAFRWLIEASPASMTGSLTTVSGGWEY